jgi:hypothetical protein
LKKRRAEEVCLKKSSFGCNERNEKEAWPYSPAILGWLHFLWCIGLKSFKTIDGGCKAVVLPLLRASNAFKVAILVH